MTLPHREDADSGAKPLTWKKARASEGSSNCVELASTRNAVRDSKNPDGPRLVFGPGAVDKLIEFVKFVKRDR